MKFHILAIGNKMPDWIKKGYMEYSQRMPREAGLLLMEIKPEKRVGKKTEQLLQAESECIRSALPPGCRIVVLDESGKQVTTVRLAELMINWMESGRDVAFIIGGADGLHQDIKQMAHEKLALSAMTLPHGLVRVLLAEQLYRAFSINRNHPYHRA
ncbi:23S rRNA (pseudouridine(1915)-N(3))-methyltransferase RlmH [Nitrosomonas sp. HPC101]|uniref:23S rRNA (pseudouridine(1915)-N(3))-methyltransferase RlmH n=1 Tax=Nitrosomonas sp. HPC101 TaxID=1658667 RepID=UPI001370ABD9|nr:23S rRNA (pseudouridine(1915)-N(3))-methyltransferase RlmH [Nitrosomonas sp. HPC101]MXS84503.1 23S rRNA (pseudouridine(1915)-N(3))-methyltransferase RlmH [Nitrosomonas sp. HPC101]